MGASPSREEKIYGPPGQDEPIAYRVHCERDPDAPGTAGRRREGDVRGVSHIRRRATVDLFMANAPHPSDKSHLRTTQAPRSRAPRPLPKPYHNSLGQFPNSSGETYVEYPGHAFKFQMPQNVRKDKTRVITDSHKKIIGLVSHEAGAATTSEHIRADEGYAPRHLSREAAENLPLDQLEWIGFARATAEPNVKRKAKKREHIAYEWEGERRYAEIQPPRPPIRTHAQAFNADRHTQR